MSDHKEYIIYLFQQKKAILIEILEIIREVILGPRRIDLGDGYSFITKYSLKNKSSLFIAQYGRIVFNLEDLLPSGVIFKLDLFYAWSVDHLNYNKPVVLIKIMRNGRDIISLFHEIDHTCDLEMADISLDSQDLISYLSQKGRNKHPIIQKSFDRIIMCERLAWAEGLRLCRKIEREFGFKLMSNKDVRSFVEKCLSSYYRFYEPLI